jgi:BASS family bile acid:Na+ symporter
MDPAGPEARNALELNIALLVLSIAFVPLAFSGLALLYGRRVGIPPLEVAKVVLSRALLPLAVGLAAARLFPRRAAGLGRVLAKITQILFILLVVVALGATWRQLLGVGLQTWLACLVVAAGAVAAGHLLGGPRPATRSILAAASAMRFPALALLLASAAAQPARLTSVVLAYVICAVLAVSLYELAVRYRGALRLSGVPRRRSDRAPRDRRAPASAGR